MNTPDFTTGDIINYNGREAVIDKVSGSSIDAQYLDTDEPLVIPPEEYPYLQKVDKNNLTEVTSNLNPFNSQTGLNEIGKKSEVDAEIRLISTIGVKDELINSDKSSKNNQMKAKNDKPPESLPPIKTEKKNHKSNGCFYYFLGSIVIIVGIMLLIPKKNDQELELKEKRKIEFETQIKNIVDKYRPCIYLQDSSWNHYTIEYQTTYADTNKNVVLGENIFLDDIYKNGSNYHITGEYFTNTMNAFVFDFECTQEQANTLSGINFLDYPNTIFVVKIYKVTKVDEEIKLHGRLIDYFLFTS